jgi:LCP family protein required for cell wall assembly
MAGGPSSGSGSSRRGRSGNDPLRGLAQLGERGGASSDAAKPANEGALKSLGERIDGGGPKGRAHTGPAHAPTKDRRRRRRWSAKRRILTALGVVIVLLGAAAGSGYAYLRYEWGKVQKVDCTSCAVVASSIAPFNVLIVGSDSRVGNTGQAAKSFGTASEVGGQRSDTIKILHVNPQAGTAQLLSIPRDTWVQMSGLPESSGLTGAQKINTAFNDGPVPLVDTIQNTFGIPINHFVVVDFLGLINAVQSVGGINMNLNYPVRDDDNGNNNSGLDITTTGCQTLNGNQVLALARSRYFQYDDPAEGGWNGDPTSDLGRIQRQNEIIEALMSKVESTYNPLTLKSFLDSVVHDITVDQNLSLTEIYDLADKYHAFSPSNLQVLTLPTMSEQNYGGDIQVVEEPEAQQMLTQFLGTTPNTPTTPPLDENDDPITVQAGTGSGATSPSTSAGAGASGSVASTTTTTTTTIPAFDPTPC